MTDRPRCVPLISAYLVFQCLFFCWLARFTGMWPLYFWAAAHLLCAGGLFYLCEWARSFTVGVSSMNLISIAILVLSGYIDPTREVLFLIGMDLYIVTALRDERIKSRFS